jgi:hypothetical protein
LLLGFGKIFRLERCHGVSIGSFCAGPIIKCGVNCTVGASGWQA